MFTITNYACAFVFRNKLDEYGVCIRVWGNISLLPEDIQRIVAEVVSMTSHNNKSVTVYFILTITCLIKGVLILMLVFTVDCQTV